MVDIKETNKVVTITKILVQNLKTIKVIIRKIHDGTIVGWGVGQEGKWV